MSSTIKPSEIKKSKNSTYQSSSNNSNLINYSKNNKLSFNSVFKTNQNKNFHNKINFDINKNYKNSLENKNNIHNINSSIKKNEEDIKKNQIFNNKNNIRDEDEKIESKKILNNVGSFQSLGFLLPQKSNNNFKSSEKTIEEKNNKNRRYANQEGYDYDENINYNNSNYYFDSSSKKRYKDIGALNKLDDNKDYCINNDDDSNIEEDLDKLKKQEELIKKLLKYKNFQNFVKKILKNRKSEENKKRKIINWSTFKKELYNIAFLDLYYRHRLPFIIMRPRLDVIKRKREQKERQIKERKKMEEEMKHNDRNLKKSSIDIKEGETTYASILDKTMKNEMEKNGYIIGEDNNTVRIEKRESLFPTKDGKPRGIFTLTKIPQKNDDDDENAGNIRLKMAFNKAKDAARVVRRLEYSYSMRVNILLSKPIFQKNAKIIQKWYRSMRFIKVNTPKVVKLQAFVRGMIIRKAFNDVRDLYERILPFIKEIDKILSRRFAKIFFEKMIPQFGILTLIKLAKIKNNKIINALSKFRKDQILKRERYSLSTIKKKKCCYTKELFDYKTKLKILKLQAILKNYLMHNSEKIILKYSNEYNPKLYYYLKYGKNPLLLKKKLKKLRECVMKFKELQMKIKYKGLNIDNKYDLLKYILRKIIFNKLKNYYKDSINNKDLNYLKRMKLKILLNHQKNNNNKRLLKKFFNKWNIKANYLSEYRKIIKEDKLLLIDLIMRYHKKFKEKIFMLLLNSIRETKTEKEKNSVNKLLSFYDKYNKKHNKKYINIILLKAFKTWKKKSKLISITKASNMINKNVKLYLANKRLRQKQKLINCFNIRNKIFKEKLKLWKFNAGKLKRYYKSFINKTLGIIKMKKKLKCLKKNFESLEKRKKNILKKYFARFQINTGVKKLLSINLQICLYDENKQIIMNDKYSMMKYIKDEHNINNIEELKNKMSLKTIFKFWKNKQRINEFKKKCGQRIKIKCELENNMLKLKFLHWFKIIRIEKVQNACILIQKKYRDYKREKNKN